MGSIEFEHNKWGSFPAQNIEHDEYEMKSHNVRGKTMKKILVVLSLVAMASTAMAGMTPVNQHNSFFEPGLNRIMNHPGFPK